MNDAGNPLMIFFKGKRDRNQLNASLYTSHERKASRAGVSKRFEAGAPDL